MIARPSGGWYRPRMRRALALCSIAGLLLAGTTGALAAPGKPAPRHDVRSSDGEIDDDVGSPDAPSFDNGDTEDDAPDDPYAHSPLDAPDPGDDAPRGAAPPAPFHSGPAEPAGAATPVSPE